MKILFVKSLGKIFVFSLMLCFLTSFTEFVVAIESQIPLKPLFEKALAASQDGDFVVALSLWDEVIEIAPDNPAALSNRGNVRLALGDPKGAISDQNHAIELNSRELDPYVNRGIAEEALQAWEAAANDYELVLQRDPGNASALYNLGNVSGAQDHWMQAKDFFNRASLARPGFAMARSSKALCDYELGLLDDAEHELRSLIRRYPMMADARAALSALLWRKGFSGEAESHWAAAAGLDNRYKQRDWLLDIRRWPHQPTDDLMSFLALERR